MYEHSRLSRNQYASAIIFNIFGQYKIELYEDKKKIDLNDPQFQFMRQVMDAVSQLERNLIVNRTTRGLHNAINNGNRGYRKLFGYTITGKNENGKTIWEPVESEINEIKAIFKKVLEGKSIRRIVYELYTNEKQNLRKLLNYISRVSLIIKHAEYTGHALTMEGLKILHAYNKFETDNISMLSDKKYWVKSTPYPLQIVSIKCRKRVHAVSLAAKENFGKYRKADKDLGTGIITCIECGSKYYTYENTKRKKNTGITNT